MSSLKTGGVLSHENTPKWYTGPYKSSFSPYK